MKTKGSVRPAHRAFGLKSGVNEADTQGVVNTVRATASFGRMAYGGAKNNMVSANASRRKK